MFHPNCTYLLDYIDELLVVLTVVDILKLTHNTYLNLVQFVV